MRFEYGALAPFCSIEKDGAGVAKQFRNLGVLGHKISHWAYDLTGSEEFVLSALCEPVDFVMLTPRHFGFESRPPASVLLDPKRLSDWSSEHLFGQSLELCEPDDALCLRGAYLHQPEGEVLAMGMTPLFIHEGVDKDTGRPWKAFAVFYVEHYIGAQWLRARYARMNSIETHHGLDSKWVFRLRTLRAPRK